MPNKCVVFSADAVGGATERVPGDEKELKAPEGAHANVNVERAAAGIAAARSRHLVAGCGQRGLRLFDLTAISSPNPRGSRAGRDLKHVYGGYRSISRAAAAVRAMTPRPNTATRADVAVVLHVRKDRARLFSRGIVGLVLRQPHQVELGQPTIGKLHLRSLVDEPLYCAFVLILDADRALQLVVDRVGFLGRHGLSLF